jgi:excinuclease UvrABC ATPase subunit
MDEPTTGLHMSDIEKIIGIMNMLVDKGNTVIVIEHNLDIIKNADWIIDIGPEGGKNGGHIVFEGTPEVIVKAENSLTGVYLKQSLA